LAGAGSGGQQITVQLSTAYNMNKQHLLDQITADMLQQNVCPDLAKTATNIVPGAGNPDADIMFVGEAPGKNEDLTGQPFVGAAGKVLEQLLQSIGLTRGDVFITSIVKYRPPNNRDPKPEEKAAFLPFLERQIQVIQPKLIVPLGRHGMESFLPGAKIGQVHGKLSRDTQGRAILPVLHPAVALYNRRMLPTLEQDFLSIPNILNTLRKGK
jgi:uracil-DNA glycosylase family 4